MYNTILECKWVNTQAGRRVSTYCGASTRQISCPDMYRQSHNDLHCPPKIRRNGSEVQVIPPESCVACVPSVQPVDTFVIPHVGWTGSASANGYRKYEGWRTDSGF